MDKKYGGVVTNWQIHDLKFVTDAIENVYPGTGAQSMVFTGTIVKDSPKWPDGYHMRSSLIVDINEDRTVIETLNTIYHMENEGNDILPELGNAVLNITY